MPESSIQHRTYSTVLYFIAPLTQRPVLAVNARDQRTGPRCPRRRVLVVRVTRHAAHLGDRQAELLHADEILSSSLPMSMRAALMSVAINLHRDTLAPDTAVGTLHAPWHPVHTVCALVPPALQACREAKPAICLCPGNNPSSTL